MAPTLTRVEAVAFIRSTNGRSFAVRFHKRGDGTLRTMNCRLRVTSRLRGGPRAYDPDEKGLIFVFDNNAPLAANDPLAGEKSKGAYRSIPIEGITEVEVDGAWHRVVDVQPALFATTAGPYAEGV